jgi:hypothetical protein
MDEMRGGMSGSASGSIKAFFLKCLIPVGISNYCTDGGGDVLLFELLLSGVALSGVVPFELAVEAFVASLQFRCWWHDVVPCGSSPNGRLLWKDGSVEVGWGIIVVVTMHDDQLDFKWLLRLLHSEHASGEFLYMFCDFCGGWWLWWPLSFSVVDSKGPIHGLA